MDASIVVTYSSANDMSFGGFGFGSQSTATPTAGATGSGLFGSTGQGQQQQPATGGSSLFGNFGAKPAAPVGAATGSGGLFGSVATSQQGQQQGQQPAGGGGMFGSNNQQQPQQSGGGLSGFSTSQPAQTISGGLFGSAPQKPADFGLPGSAAQPTRQPAAGSSFLGSATQSAQQPSTTGLFGSASQTQPSTGTGLFGLSTQSAQQPPSTSLFGSTAQSMQNPSTSLFGQSTTQTQPTQNQQQLQTSTNQQGSNGGVEKTTKFSELPEIAQKYIEQLDNAIKTQKAIASELHTEPLGRAIWQTSLDVKAASEEHAAIFQTLNSLKRSISQLRDKLLDQSRDVERIKDIWDIYKSGDGRMGQIKLGAYKEFPQEFFSKIASSMEERVNRYKKTLAQLHRIMGSLCSEVHTPSSQAIGQSINNHQQAILALAVQLDQLQARMNNLKAGFTSEWRDKTGSVRDPFEMAREERNVKV
ncbi:hypothetical protein L204_103735 [Cryptococcus depauperatus]